MAFADSYRRVPILLVDVAGFTAKYPGLESKRAILRRLQLVLASAARRFLSGNVWRKWLRHDVGDGYYIVPATLTPQAALAYALCLGDELTRARRPSRDEPELQLRIVLAFGDVEAVDDQLLSEAFIDARRFIDDMSFSDYARRLSEPIALLVTDQFYHELQDEPAETSDFPKLKSVRFTPVEIRDKHGVVHRGQVLGPGWDGVRETTTRGAPADFSVPRIRFVDEIFETLAAHPILMLLAQDDQDQGELIPAILDRARRGWGNGNVLFVTPPYSTEVDLERYFARLGRQCGFSEEIRDAFAWDDALDARLSRGTRLFLLIHGLDNGPDRGRRVLAGTLRSLRERHSQKLRVLLTGGEKLAKLKFEHGSMSLLNTAEILPWPELEVADVEDWIRRHFPGRQLGEERIAMLLETCGGHPRLLRYLLHRWEQDGQLSPEACGKALGEYPYLRERFEAFGKNPEARKRVCALLAQEDLGSYYPWPADPLLRHVYWSNLAVTKDNRLRWRSELLRQVGSRVLRCET